MYFFDLVRYVRDKICSGENASQGKNLSLKRQSNLYCHTDKK